MTMLDRPFVGSEAMERGLVRGHELRSRYRAVFPDIYVPKDVELPLYDRALAGWLWSHRQGVIAGLTASALHGAKWVDDAAPVEMVWPNARPAAGLRTYDYRLRTDEFGELDDMRVTTPARTGFDIVRRRPLDAAVANLDALGNATGLSAHEVLRVARKHRGARGLRQLAKVLDLYDPGAASPKETWLRLLVIRADYPRPRTQIPVVSRDGRRQYYLDMGWEDMMLALEYDGEQHRVNDLQYAYDIQRSEDLDELGWTRLMVVKQNRATDVLRRLERFWRSKLQADREIS
jgi:very-short-patch-repair endonuclease